MAETPSHLRPSGAAAPDCRDCGACCHGEDLWVLVDADDEERLGARARRLTVLDSRGRGYVARRMAVPLGRCVAFADALPDGAGSGCSIYEVRPGACRALEAGSPDGLSARARRGLD